MNNQEMILDENMFCQVKEREIVLKVEMSSRKRNVLEMVVEKDTYTQG